MGELILVADSDPNTLGFVEVNLRLEDFEVVVARDGEETLRKAYDLAPALVLFDVLLAGIDGLEVCRRLRVDPRTGHIPLIILTAKSLTTDKVVGLTAGADDYILKPFDPQELTARVRTTLRRTSELRTTSPLTGLPGNHRIEAELARRLDAGEELALVYADLNDFKAFNDRYGFLRGDDVIMATAQMLRAALDRHTTGGFAGHIGGDDFMLICRPADVTRLCETVIAEFNRRTPLLYDPEEAARGYVEVPDRRGELRRFPLVSIALGVATTQRRRFTSHREMVEAATEMKSYLKLQRRRSAYAVDERSGSDQDAGCGQLDLARSSYAHGTR